MYATFLYTFSNLSPSTHPISGSAPSNDLFDVSTAGLLLEACPFLFPVCLLIFESLLFFSSVTFYPVLSVSVYPSPLVSAAPPAVASGVDPLMFVIVADHPIADSERTIPGLFLPFGVKIFEFSD